MIQRRGRGVSMPWLCDENERGRLERILINSGRWETVREGPLVASNRTNGKGSCSSYTHDCCI